MIDWFKAVGIFLIVFGHLDGDFTNTLTLPVRLKQLGVVFFIFIMGWQLARETRPLWIVLFNRLFKVYFWGLVFALIFSMFGVILSGNLCESNYLPFFGGINVFLDYFPANPTTWYIGVYIHLLLFWAICLRKLKITMGILLITIVLEVLVRWLLMPYGLYRAYMVLFNWQTVFLTGMFLGQRQTDFIKPDQRKRNRALIQYAVFILAWFSLVTLIPITRRFPFDLILSRDGSGLPLITSTAISLVYISHAWFFFSLTRYLAENKLVEFFSRNTLIIFIVHMPVWYFIAPYMRAWIPWHPIRIVLDLVVLYVGIGGLSFVLEKYVPWKKCKLMIQSRLIGQERM